MGCWLYGVLTPLMLPVLLCDMSSRPSTPQPPPGTPPPPLLGLPR
jgi:hypothetical protein